MQATVHVLGSRLKARQVIASKGGAVLALAKAEDGMRALAEHRRQVGCILPSTRFTPAATATATTSDWLGLSPGLSYSHTDPPRQARGPSSCALSLTLGSPLWCSPGCRAEQNRKLSGTVSPRHWCHVAQCFGYIL